MVPDELTEAAFYGSEDVAALDEGEIPVGLDMTSRGNGDRCKNEVIWLILEKEEQMSEYNIFASMSVNWVKRQLYSHQNIIK